MGTYPKCNETTSLNLTSIVKTFTEINYTGLPVLMGQDGTGCAGTEPGKCYR